MLANPFIKDFQLRFSEGFFFKEVVDEFSDYFGSETSMYLSMCDFVNHTIIETEVLGYTSEPTAEQSFRRGNNRTFSNTTHKNKKISKDINITFSLKKSYLNYMILLRNAQVYDKYNNEQSDNGKIFFEPLFLDVYDANGNILYKWTYREIQIVDISSIQLSKKDKGIGNKTFELKLKFNEVDFNVFMGEKADLKPEYKHIF